MIDLNIIGFNPYNTGTTHIPYTKVDTMLNGYPAMLLISISLFILSSLSHLNVAMLAATANAISSLCSIISNIGSFIAIISLLMFILGGTLYAVAHFLPSAGNFRSGLQGWGMGMIIGGVLVLVLYFIGPYIIDTIITIGSGGNGFGINSISIPSCT